MGYLTRHCSKVPTGNSRTMIKRSKLELICNFWLYCNYSLSELSNSGACGNLPGFLYHFSHTTAKSSKSELIRNLWRWCGYFPISELSISSGTNGGFKSLFQILKQWWCFFKNQMVKTSNSFIFWNIKQKSFLLATKTWNRLLSTILYF